MIITAYEPECFQDTPGLILQRHGRVPQRLLFLSLTNPLSSFHWFSPGRNSSVHVQNIFMVPLFNTCITHQMQDKNVLGQGKSVITWYRREINLRDAYPQNIFCFPMFTACKTFPRSLPFGNKMAEEATAVWTKQYGCWMDNSRAPRGGSVAQSLCSACRRSQV